MPWKARAVNRTFKAVIESYHVEHFLKTIELDVEVGEDDGCSPDDEPMFATYTFERFEGGDNARALVSGANLLNNSTVETTMELT